MKENSSLYSLLGVSADKDELHGAIQGFSKGLFPSAFCKILPDIGGDSDYCLIMHADGTGTKTSLAYAYWKETGDVSVLKNIPIDGVVMNLDDLICVGATGPFYINQVINRNRFNFPGEPLTDTILATEAYLEKLRETGVPILHAGGETADVGDVVRTFIIDNSIIARMKRSDIIDCKNVAPGNIIVGLSSYGQASYENEYNSGIGSNGLTLARHGLFASYLGEKYPEIFDGQNLTNDKTFFGKWRLEDVPEGHNLPIGKLALSPTRSYAPIILSFLEKVERKKVTGIIHCTGGGQTKCRNKFKSIHVVKDSLFDPPFIFKELFKTGKVKEREMYQDFNMGHRMEVYCADQETANTLIACAHAFHIDAQIIGKCKELELKKDKEAEKVKISIKSWLGTSLEYEW